MYSVCEEAWTSFDGVQIVWIHFNRIFILPRGSSGLQWGSAGKMGMVWGSGEKSN